MKERIIEHVEKLPLTISGESFQGSIILIFSVAFILGYLWMSTKVADRD